MTPLALGVDQVLALAPDASSASAARKLGTSKPWRGLGRSERALWGLCQGSAVYQVRVDLNDFGTKCSCPSRKFPCKHALGLLLVAATESGAFGADPPPEWVAEWIGKRTTRAEAREAKTAGDGSGADEKAPDPVAQAKRQAQRLDRVAKGLDALDLFMNDLLRNGLAAPELTGTGEGRSVFEAQAARLVDAQAPGLAARVRRLAEIPGSGDDWPSRLLDELGRIALLSHAFRRLDALRAPLQADVRNLIGFAASQDEVIAAGESVTDDWAVVGQLTSDDERVRVERSWLVGARTRRAALVLQFAAGSLPFPERIVAGTSFEGELVYWPSASPQRALIKTRVSATRALRGSLPGEARIEVFLGAVATAVAAQPWLGRALACLSNVTPVPGDVWWARDAEGAGLPLAGEHHARLLALSGGRPVDLAAEWDGARLSPLGVVAEGAFHTLRSAE